MSVMSRPQIRPIRRVQVVLPSSLPNNLADLEVGIDWLRAEGLEVSPPLERSVHQLSFLAGPDLARAQELAGALADPNQDAVWCGRGGSGALRTLQALDHMARSLGAGWRRTTPGGLGEGRVLPRPLAEPARRQIPLVGLSDATALLLGRQRHSPPGVAIHGPVITQLSRLDDASADAMRTWLRYPDQLPVLRAATPGPLVPGSAEGQLVAGNLSLLAACVGTPEAVDSKGKILLVEEVGEPAYRIDRLFAQLWRSGALHGLRGLAFGTWTDCEPGAAVRDCLLDWGRLLDVPCCLNLPVGHGAACQPVGLGLRYRLDADRGILAPLQTLSNWLETTATAAGDGASGQR